jgi:hypothetical protein
LPYQGVRLTKAAPCSGIVLRRCVNSSFDGSRVVSSTLSSRFGTMLVDQVGVDVQAVEHAQRAERQHVRQVVLELDAAADDVA